MAIQHQTICSILANLPCNMSRFPWAMTCRVVPDYTPNRRISDLI